MAEEEALLAAVAADPGDDAPRLVYADWLDEHEDPDRAAFIRLQCYVDRQTDAGSQIDLTQLPGGQWPDDFLSRYQDEWTHRLRAAGATNIRFIRGFPGEFGMDADLLLALLDELPTLAPGCEAVGVRGATPAAVGRLADHQWMARLRGLAFFGNGEHGPAGTWDEAVAGLVASPNCPRLRRDLWFENCDIGPAGVRAVAGAARFAAMTKLGLDYCPRVGDGGVDALVESDSLGALENLDLRGCGISLDGTVTLLKSPLCGRLDELWFYPDEFTDAWADRLIREPDLRMPRVILLRATRLSADACRRLKERFPQRFDIAQD